MASFSLEDYGVIGNFSSAALVNRAGSVDWACLPYLDSPSHFASILDDSRGGRFQIAPHGDFRSHQRYHQRTLVLETSFETPFGRAVVTDWMPLQESSSHEPVIYRQIDMIEGKIYWSLHCSPRFDYAETTPDVELHGAWSVAARGGSASWSPQRILFRGKGPGQLAQLFCSAPIDYQMERNSAQARFSLGSGESVMFAWAWGRRIETPEFQSFKQTIEEWRLLAHSCSTLGCPFAGPWHDVIIRSSLFLKLLIAPYSGSIAEAVTTSIPAVFSTDLASASDQEQPPDRNWDHRFAWITHGVMSMQALVELGYLSEAQNYFGWLSEIIIRDGIEGLQPVYTLDGGHLGQEEVLPHLKGFHNSRPVRIGNEAASRFHLDIYGHVLLACEYALKQWGSLPEGLWKELVNIADLVCQAWRRPDFGPWEMRKAKPEHYVVSKVFCWVALDRAISMAKNLNQEVPKRWVEEAKILHRTICDQGFNPSLGAFVRSFGDTLLDASSLWIALTGFLPPEDSRVVGTLSAILEQLSEGVLIVPSRTDEQARTGEGAHLESSFLLVSVLALSNRVDEASDRLAELCTFTTHLGILGDQVNLSIDETSGNFPSARAHLALINAALYVSAARGRQISTLLLGNNRQKAVRPTTASRRSA